MTLENAHYNFKNTMHLYSKQNLIYNKNLSLEPMLFNINPLQRGEYNFLYLIGKYEHSMKTLLPRNLYYYKYLHNQNNYLNKMSLPLTILNTFLLIDTNIINIGQVNKLHLISRATFIMEIPVFLNILLKSINHMNYLLHEMPYTHHQICSNIFSKRLYKIISQVYSPFYLTIVLYLLYFSIHIQTCSMIFKTEGSPYRIVIYFTSILFETFISHISDYTYALIGKLGKIHSKNISFYCNTYKNFYHIKGLLIIIINKYGINITNIKVMIRLSFPNQLSFLIVYALELLNYCFKVFIFHRTAANCTDPIKHVNISMKCFLLNQINNESVLLILPSVQCTPYFTISTINSISSSQLFYSGNIIMFMSRPSENRYFICTSDKFYTNKIPITQLLRQSFPTFNITLNLSINYNSLSVIPLVLFKNLKILLTWNVISKIRNFFQMLLINVIHSTVFPSIFFSATNMRALISASFCRSQMQLKFSPHNDSSTMEY